MNPLTCVVCIAAKPSESTTLIIVVRTEREPSAATAERHAGRY